MFYKESNHLNNIFFSFLLCTFLKEGFVFVLLFYIKSEMYFKHNFLMTDKIDQYCNEHPTAIVKHQGNCGWYYNCSNRDSTIGKYIQECRYPQLFSTITKRCEDFTDVNCVSRHEPQAPCK